MTFHVVQIQIAGLLGLKSVIPHILPIYLDTLCEYSQCAGTMSQQITRPGEDSIQDFTPQLHTDVHENTTEQPLPPFQSFPARDRPVPIESIGSVPQRRAWNTNLESSFSVAYDSSYHFKTMGSLITQSSEQGVEGAISTIEGRTSVLPEFTPFPAAAPSSRYAPPPNSRAELTRPVLPPIIYPDGVGNGPWASESTTNLVGESSTPVVRYPR
jgi:hypothetical protein